MNEHFDQKSKKIMMYPACNNTRHELFGVKNDYDLFRCLSCSLVFVDPMPSSKELDEFCQKKHEFKHIKFKLNLKPTLKVVISK